MVMDSTIPLDDDGDDDDDDDDKGKKEEKGTFGNLYCTCFQLISVILTNNMQFHGN